MDAWDKRIILSLLGIKPQFLGHPAYSSVPIPVGNPYVTCPHGNICTQLFVFSLNLTMKLQSSTWLSLEMVRIVYMGFP